MLVLIRILAVFCFCLFIFMVFQYLVSMIDFSFLERTRSRLGFFDQTSGKKSWSSLLALFSSIPYPRFLSGIIPERLLMWSGIKITPRFFYPTWWMSVILVSTLTVGFLFIGAGDLFLAGILLLLICTAVGPYLVVKYLNQRRKLELESSLADYLDLLSLTLEAGFGLLPALQRINQGYSGVLGEIMRGVVFQIDLGYSKADALKSLVSRAPSDDLRQFVDAVLLSERLGTSLARTIRIQAGLSRERRRQRAEIKARTTPIRIIPALVFFFLPGLLLIYLAPPIIKFLILK